MTRTPDWPADKVERRALADLVPYRKARTHSEAQVAQIAASIREWGWTVPVGELQGLDFDLDLLGFDPDSLAGVLNEPGYVAN